MDKSIISENSSYSCLICKVSVPQSLILAHISLYGNHRICKNKQDLPKKDIQKLVCEKIEAITKIQAQIQQSSVTLTKSILLNTQTEMNKLNEIIRLYKNISLELPKNFKETEIISNFCDNSTLNKALVDHFQQKILEVSFATEKKTKAIKTQISKRLENNCDYFCSMIVANSEDFIITGGQSGFIRIWDVKNNTQSFVFKKFKASVYALAISSDDSLMLSGSDDCVVRLWDLKLKKKSHSFRGHERRVTAVLISNDQRTGFSGSWDCTIKIWDLETKEIEFSTAEIVSVSAITLFDNEKIIVAVGFQGIVFWHRNEEIHSEISEENTTAIAFSKNERHFVTGDSDGIIRIRLTKTCKIIFEEKKYTSEVGKIVFSTCYKYFATCAYKKDILFWNFNQNCVLRTMNFEFNIRCAYFLKKSFSFAICQLNSPVISFYNLETEVIQEKINPKRLDLKGIAISNDLKYIAYGGLTLKLYKTKTNKKVNMITLCESDYSCVKFSPNSIYLGIGCKSGQIFVLRVPCLTLVYNFEFCKSEILSLSFSMNNKYIACGETEEKFSVQSIEKNEVVYYKESIRVFGSLFCCKDKRLIYSIFMYYINIVDENFVKLAKLKFDFIVYRLFATKDDKDVLVSDCQSFFSFVNITTCEIKLSKLSIKTQKKLNLKDPKLHAFINLPRVNIS